MTESMSNKTSKTESMSSKLSKTESMSSKTESSSDGVATNVNSIPRNSSENGLDTGNNVKVNPSNNKSTVSKYWERSQSAYDLDPSKDKPRYTSTSTLECAAPGEPAGNKVSEHSSVYWDLSNADDEASRHGKFKISLQTIHQKEEMTSSNSGGNTGGTSSPTVSIQARVVRRMSTETLSQGGVAKSEYSEYSLPAAEFSIPGSPQVSAHNITPMEDGSLVFSTPISSATNRTLTFTVNQSTKPNLTLVLSHAIPAMKKNIQALGGIISEGEKCSALKNILGMIEQAWAMPTIGRDLAYGLCDVLRNDGGLEILISNCKDEEINREVALNSAQILAQSMTVSNRDFVAKKGLEVIVKMAARAKEDPQMAQATTGILESLFKHSRVTCSKLIKFGGLDTVLYSCRTSDTEILRHCAVALANLAIYGGEENQQLMIEHKAHEWLFPLAFSNDDSIRYYAFLAIAALSSNKELETAVVKSGTLGLVEPFIKSHDPIKFGKSDYAHMHGQSKDWLSHLLPLLSSKREEALSLAAFHFAMEAAILQERGKLEIFKEIGAIEPLKRLASSTYILASKFAGQALELIGEEIPQKLSPRVPLWTSADIQLWLHQTTVSKEVIKCFEESNIDGDLLLLLTEENLKEDFNIKSGITRRMFMRELDRLKQTADYDSCDSSRLADWLKDIGEEFRQYTYQMVQCGVDRRVLRLLTDENLLRDCGIHNGVHRLKILEAARRLSSITCSPVGGACGQIYAPPGTIPDERAIDAFISYRRSNGSQLASLLKVHLQLRGFTIFLDIEKLRAGKFDDNLLHSVRNARTFILVLTPNALDRCVGDTELKDWIHREVVAALEGGCNIIPIMDNFQFPAPETLPTDMRPICFFNSIRWIHDYQDACVDKLENFINGELSTRTQSVSRAPMSKVNSLSSPVPRDLHGSGPTLSTFSPPVHFPSSTSPGSGQSSSSESNPGHVAKQSLTLNSDHDVKGNS